MKSDQQISAEFAASMLGITRRHLHRLQADGWIKKSDAGRFTLAGTVQGYVSFLKDENRRGSQVAAKNRTSDARAREIELRIAQKERTLIPLEDAKAAMLACFGAIRAEIQGASANMTRDRELRNRLQDAHDGILKRASERIARQVAAIRAGRDDPAAADEDDAGGVGEDE